MQNYSTDEFTHFVGRSLPTDEERFALLVRILDGGVLLDPKYHDKFDQEIFFIDLPEAGRRVPFFPRPYMEVAVGNSVSSNEAVSAEIVCFADIPVDQLSLHTSKYSQFGLSLPKAHVVKHGGSPVFYVADSAKTTLGLVGQDDKYRDFFEMPKSRGLLADNQPRAQFFDRLLARHLEILNARRDRVEARALAYKAGNDDAEEIYQELLGVADYMLAFFGYVIGYMKVFDPTLSATDPSNFYMEREWRVLGAVPFELGEILHVFVPAEMQPKMKSRFPNLADRVIGL